jgi:hypothetical protein
VRPTRCTIELERRQCYFLRPVSTRTEQTLRRIDRQHEDMLYTAASPGQPGVAVGKQLRSLAVMHKPGC